MLNRRQLLATGLALSWLPVARVATAASSRAPLPGPLVVLVDRRHAASRALGHALSARGARVVDCAGDVSQVWRELLGPLVPGGTDTVTGLTSPATLLCLERLALAQGLCVTHRMPSAGADRDWRHDAAGLAVAPLVRWQIAVGPRA